MNISDRACLCFISYFHCEDEGRVLHFSTGQVSVVVSDVIKALLETTSHQPHKKKKKLESKSKKRDWRQPLGFVYLFSGETSLNNLTLKKLTEELWGRDWAHPAPLPPVLRPRTQRSLPPADATCPKEATWPCDSRSSSFLRSTDTCLEQSSQVFQSLCFNLRTTRKWLRETEV